MEGKVFPSPAVAEVLNEKYVETRLHVDVPDRVPDIEENRRLQREYARTIALPVYVAIDPGTGQELGRFEGADLGGAKFRAFLLEAAAKAPPRVSAAR